MNPKDRNNLKPVFIDSDCVNRKDRTKIQYLYSLFEIMRGLGTMHRFIDSDCVKPRHRNKTLFIDSDRLCEAYGHRKNKASVHPFGHVGPKDRNKTRTLFIDLDCVKPKDRNKTRPLFVDLDCVKPMDTKIRQGLCSLISIV